MIKFLYFWSVAENLVITRFNLFNKVILNVQNVDLELEA